MRSDNAWLTFTNTFFEWAMFKDLHSLCNFAY